MTPDEPAQQSEVIKLYYNRLVSCPHFALVYTVRNLRPHSRGNVNIFRFPPNYNVKIWNTHTKSHLNRSSRLVQRHLLGSAVECSLW